MKKKNIRTAQSLTAPDLTIKQKAFADALIENGGNKTEAALAAYDCKNRDTGHTIGYRVSKVPQVAAYIQKRLAEAAIPDLAVESLRESLKATQHQYNNANGEFEEFPDYDRRLKASDQAFRLMDAYPQPAATPAGPARLSGTELAELDYWTLRYLAENKGKWPSEEDLERFKTDNCIEVEVS